MPLISSEHALLRLGELLRSTGYAFTTVTPATHERVNSRAGNESARDLRDVFGWSRRFMPDILPGEVWVLMNEAGIVVPDGASYRSVLRLSSLSGELFWHSAYPTVQNDAVFFGPDTYRYAIAIEQWLASNDKAPLRTVDIGCGSGAGAVLIARHHPDCQTLAIDINQTALRLTRINAALAGTENVEACYSDLLNDVEGEFDLIIANPPYLVDPAERAYRHGGGPLGAGLSLQIVEAAKCRLAPGGTLLLYTGAAIVDGCDPFRHEVESRLAGLRFEFDYREMDPDVFGEELEQGVYREVDRIAAVVLTVKQRPTT